MKNSPLTLYKETPITLDTLSNDNNSSLVFISTMYNPDLIKTLASRRVMKEVLTFTTIHRVSKYFTRTSNGKKEKEPH